MSFSFLKAQLSRPNLMYAKVLLFVFYFRGPRRPVLLNMGRAPGTWKSEIADNAARVVYLGNNLFPEMSTLEILSH